MCGLDLSSWTLPDRETHADACVARALEGGTTVSPRETRGVRHDRPPRRAETNADTHAETDPSSISAGGGASCDAFLDRHGLARYAPAFAREALFPSDLPSLTREDLRDVLGVRDERDAATFFAAVRGSRSFATDGIGAVRPFVSGDGGAERRARGGTDDRRSANFKRRRSVFHDDHDYQGRGPTRVLGAARRRVDASGDGDVRVDARRAEKRVVFVGSRGLPQSGTFRGSDWNTFRDSRNVVA
jgi:hypothetical protein